MPNTLDLRVIIQLATKQKSALNRIAKSRRLSLSAIIREAIDQYLAALASQSEERAK